MTTEAAPATPPVAARNPIVRSHHGDDVEDAYEWFRAKEDAAVIAHLEAENAYTKERTAHLAGLQEAIFDEIKGRTLETDLSVPTRRGDWWYYGRTVEGKQYGIQCRAPLASADDWTPPELSPDVEVPGEQVLLDGNVEAEGHEFFSLGSFEVSNDGRSDAVRRRRRRRRALHRARARPRHRRAAARRDPRHVRRRDLLPRRPVHRLHDGR